jgi:hypothetical protein
MTREGTHIFLVATQRCRELEIGSHGGCGMRGWVVCSMRASFDRVSRMQMMVDVGS